MRRRKPTASLVITATPQPARTARAKWLMARRRISLARAFLPQELSPLPPASLRGDDVAAAGAPNLHDPTTDRQKQHKSRATSIHTEKKKKKKKKRNKCNRNITKDRQRRAKPKSRRNTRVALEASGEGETPRKGLSHKVSQKRLLKMMELEKHRREKSNQGGQDE